MPMSADSINSTRYASKYVVLGSRPPSPEEIFVRRVARDLKIPTDDAIELAAPAMATLIDAPCWLVPVPASNGDLTANLKLAHAIGVFVPGARVKCAVRRIRPVESSYDRRKRGLSGLTLEEHGIVRVTGPLQVLPVFFIDNVVTTGTTIEACRRALGWGTGLVYADASTRRTGSVNRSRENPASFQPHPANPPVSFACDCRR